MNKSFLLLKEAELNIQFYSEECLLQDQHYLQLVLDKWILKKDQLIQTLPEDEAWEVMSSFNAFYNDLKNKDEKHPKYYYKVVRQPSAIKWDAEEYKQFWNRFGKEFLPKLIDYEIFDSYIELKMEYIEGASPHDTEKKMPITFNYGLLLQYVSNKIIPCLYEWSGERKVRGSSSDTGGDEHGKNQYEKIYYHNDLTPNNFLITKKGKIYLIDIDSFYWRTFEEIQDITYSQETFVPEPPPTKRETFI